MATTNAHQSVTTKVNDGGSFIGDGGLAADKLASAMSNNIDVNDVNGAIDTSYGSRIVAKSATGRPKGDEATDNPDGVTTAHTGGAGLAYNVDARAGDRNFILRAAGTTGAGKINNTASTLLNSSAREHDSSTRHGGPSVGVGVNRPIGTMTYNMLAQPSTDRVPGRTITGASGVNIADGTSVLLANAFVDGTTAGGLTAGSDNEAVKQANWNGIPGELTYMFGGKKAKSDSYKRRDLKEGT